MFSPCRSVSCSFFKIFYFSTYWSGVPLDPLVLCLALWSSPLGLCPGRPGPEFPPPSLAAIFSVFSSVRPPWVQLRRVAFPSWFLGPAMSEWAPLLWRVAYKHIVRLHMCPPGGTGQWWLIAAPPQDQESLPPLTLSTLPPGDPEACIRIEPVPPGAKASTLTTRPPGWPFYVLNAVQLWGLPSYCIFLEGIVQYLDTVCTVLHIQYTL